MNRLTKLRCDPYPSERVIIRVAGGIEKCQPTLRLSAQVHRSQSGQSQSGLPNRNNNDNNNTNFIYAAALHSKVKLHSVVFTGTIAIQ